MTGSVGTFETPGGIPVTVISWPAPFEAKARNAARRSGIFGLDKPHIWKADGRWSRTRSYDPEGLGLNEDAMAHRDRLAEADRCPV